MTGTPLFVNRRCYYPAAIFVFAILLLPHNGLSQQFNSDSWLSKAHGTVTIIPTWGQRNSMLMTTYSLFPKWEFTIAGYLYNNDRDSRTADGYSTSLYAKYMFYQNKSETGGASVKFGTGMKPGTISGEDREKDAFKSYWVNFPCTVPFFNNTLSIDLMPGVSVTRNYGVEEITAWSFTYSARVAWYPFDMKWSAVGEVFGTEGQNVAIPEFKTGIRWEPTPYVVFAVTYGQEFNGTKGAGFEIGAMLFSPPFACLGGCAQKGEKWSLFKKKKKT
ncbi:hypothetical protein [Pollutibacter soli]|uniref:hypothetical protein n=1 Tax=Pollutibacter soli TaxID=3034157 RepID=UPI003013F369